MSLMDPCWGKWPQAFLPAWMAMGLCHLWWEIATLFWLITAGMEHQSKAIKCETTLMQNTLLYAALGINYPGVGLHIWIVTMVDMMLFGSIRDAHREDKSQEPLQYPESCQTDLLLPSIQSRPTVHPAVKILDPYVGATMIMELLSTWPTSLLPRKCQPQTFIIYNLDMTFL